MTSSCLAVSVVFSESQLSTNLLTQEDLMLISQRKNSVNLIRWTDTVFITLARRFSNRLTITRRRVSLTLESGTSVSRAMENRMILFGSHTGPAAEDVGKMRVALRLLIEVHL